MKLKRKRRIPPKETKQKEITPVEVTENSTFNISSPSTVKKKENTLSCPVMLDGFVHTNTHAGTHKKQNTDTAKLCRSPQKYTNAKYT